MDQISLFLPSILGAVILSVMMSLLGLFVVWRRMTFLSLTLAQLASLGTLIGYCVNASPLVSSIMTTLLGVVVVKKRFTEQILHKDNINAFLYIFSGSLIVIMLVMYPSIDWGPDKIFGGNLLYLMNSDLKIIVPVALFFLLFLKFNRKNWVALTVNEQENFFVDVWQDRLFFLITALLIALTSRWAGLMFCFGSILFPALFVNILNVRVKTAFMLVVIYSFVCAGLGIFLALRLNLPLGASIVICMGFAVIIEKIIKSIFCLTFFRKK
ncbi:metal ABC transporter permease [bacterium]|nr:metal ABC transporter permease [bacterium]